jgi:hypothetical protein
MSIVKVENVRISFPNLFEAKAINGEGEPRFSSAFVIVPGSARTRRWPPRWKPSPRRSGAPRPPASSRS